jgi:MraZ protein
VSTFKPQTPVVATAPAPTLEGGKSPATAKASKKQPMPYCGKYGALIDSHCRMTLPAEVHEMMANPRPRVLYVLPGEEQCIDIYTETGIRKVLATLAQSEENDDAERERRILLSKISRVEVRADGELKLPAELVREAIVDTNAVVIIGVSDHFEIWDAQRWQEYNQPADAEPASFDHLTHSLGTVIKHVLGEVPLPFELNNQADDPNQRMRELLNQSDGMRSLEEDREQIWFTDQPSHLNPQRIHGGIQ